jgi:hypothetical protein
LNYISNIILLSIFLTFQFSQESKLDYTILDNNDTDKDGYSDLEEQHFGSNFRDSLSVIYEGGWPYNVDKLDRADIKFRDCNVIPYGNGCECTKNVQCMEASDCEILFTSQNCVPKKGAKLPRFIGTDQFGDNVDLYDLMNQGHPIIIEVSAMWSNPSNLLAGWLAGNSTNIKKMKWWQDNFEEVKTIINSKEVYYVRVLHQGPVKGEPITSDEVAYWHKEFPNINIITIADPEAKIKTWVRPTGLPCIMLFNEDLTISTPAEGNNADAQRRRGLKAPFEALINFQSQK